MGGGKAVGGGDRTKEKNGMAIDKSDNSNQGVDLKKARWIFTGTGPDGKKIVRVGGEKKTKKIEGGKEMGEFQQTAVAVTT